MLSLAVVGSMTKDTSETESPASEYLLQILLVHVDNGIALQTTFVLLYLYLS